MTFSLRKSEKSLLPVLIFFMSSSPFLLAKWDLYAGSTTGMSAIGTFMGFFTDMATFYQNRRPAANVFSLPHVTGNSMAWYVLAV
jgi:hypothetical protein